MCVCVCVVFMAGKGGGGGGVHVSCQEKGTRNREYEKKRGAERLVRLGCIGWSIDRAALAAGDRVRGISVHRKLWDDVFFGWVSLRRESRRHRA